MITLEREIVELKERVEHLEAVIRRLVGDESQRTLPISEKPVKQEQLLAWLKTQGFIRESTPEERRLAAEWDALLDEEKQVHIHFMHNLVLDPPLSGAISQIHIGLGDAYQRLITSAVCYNTHDVNLCLILKWTTKPDYQRSASLIWPFRDRPIF